MQEPRSIAASLAGLFGVEIDASSSSLRQARSPSSPFPVGGGFAAVTASSDWSAGADEHAMP